MIQSANQKTIETKTSCHMYKTVWGIHGGRAGEAEDLFLGQSVIALGWSKLGDMSVFEANRDIFKNIVLKNYSEKKPGAIPNIAGQLLRFVHELERGDLVVFPAKSDRQIHIGRIEGSYFYSPSTHSQYPHQRTVSWIRSLPRTHFSQGALYEVGSSMSFFKIKNYADEFIRGLETSGDISDTDESVGVVADEIEQTTKDFILKTLSRELKGHPFAEFVADLMEAMGYNTHVASPGPDGGIDIIAHKDELGFEPPIIKVQVTSRDACTGDPGVSALYGKVDFGEFGLYVALGGFSRAAKDFARGKTNLRLVDGDHLVDLVLEHYNDLDTKFRSLLPLKRVFVPTPVTSVDEEV